MADRREATVAVPAVSVSRGHAHFLFVRKCSGISGVDGHTARYARKRRTTSAYDYVRGYVSGREARGDVSNGMQTRFPGGTGISGWSRSECVRVYGQSEPHERAQYISVCRRNGGSDSALSAAPVQLSAGRGPSRESAMRGVLERFFRLKSSIFELFSVQHDV